MRRWLTRSRETSRLETTVRSLAALAILAIAVFVGPIGVVGILPLLLVVGGWRRRPRLILDAQDADANGVIWGPRERWPVAADRIVANERIRLAGHLDAHEKFTKTSVGAFTFGSMPVSDQAYADARDAFLAKADEYGESLRRWLTEYDHATAIDETTFRLRFSVGNGENWTSHAEGVRLEIALPDSVRRVHRAPSVQLPLAAPDYEPPPRQPVFGRALAGYAGQLAYRRVEPLSATPQLKKLRAPLGEIQRSAWADRNGGSDVWAEVGDVYVGGSQEITEELILQLTEPTVTLQWRLLFKDGSTRGSLTLRRPEPRATVPAFGRLAGLLSYPDVAITDDAGEIVHAKRMSDPPLAAPSSRDEPSHDVLGRLRMITAVNEWEELGLDPTRGRDDRRPA